MSSYGGAHPAIGALDVCPLVWLDSADRDAARTEALAVAAQIGGLGVPVFLYGELARGPGPRRARLLPQRRPGRALAADGGGGAAAGLRAEPAAPARRRDPPHRPPAAGRLQRRARQRRPRARPRRRRRPARVRRRPARGAGDRAGALQRPRPGLDQRPRPAGGAAGRWWSSGCGSWPPRSAPGRWRPSWSAWSRPPPWPATRRTCRCAASTPSGT